ncbi:MAG: DoxX family membrane protein [Acidobacteriota bacterium]
MAKLPLVARLLLGLIFTVFGLNGFFNFIPIPEPTPAGGEFLGALVKSGYLMSLVKCVEVVGGVLLLAGRYVPLALTVLAPITINILLYHVFLDPRVEGMVMPVLMVALHLFLAYGYRSSFRGVLDSSAQPS